MSEEKASEETRKRLDKLIERAEELLAVLKLVRRLEAAFRLVEALRSTGSAFSSDPSAGSTGCSANRSGLNG